MRAWRSAIRRTALAVVLAGIGLAACVPLTREQISRETARNVVRPIVADQVPAASVETVTDCVVVNASNAELNQIARTSITGLTVGAFNTIMEIAARPQTQACIATRQATPAAR